MTLSSYFMFCSYKFPSLPLSQDGCGGEMGVKVWGVVDRDLQMVRGEDYKWQALVGRIGESGISTLL